MRVLNSVLELEGWRGVALLSVGEICSQSRPEITVELSTSCEIVENPGNSQSIMSRFS